MTDAPFTFAAPFGEAEAARIHAASLEVLGRVGLTVHADGARAVFARHGCAVDPGTGRVTFPAAVVERYRKAMPPAFTFHGRNPARDRTIPEQGPVMVTASSAPDLVDPDTGAVRRATAADVARIARLVQALDGYDVFSISTLADDAPPGRYTVARLAPAIRHCDKPIRVTTADLDDARSVLALLHAVAGGEEAYRARPFVTHHYCPVISPLTMERSSTEGLVFFLERGLPVYPSIVPTSGSTAPMSPAGTLVQGNAEFLAAAVLIQMVREGAPVIYATLPTAADPRDGAYASGGIECGALHIGFSRMARFYGVPCGGYVGLTNSKANDAQAGWETGLSAMAGTLAGMDMLNMGGLVEALKVYDEGKAVADAEVAAMLKFARRPLAADDCAAAVEVIARTGPGGCYLEDEDTAVRMRAEAFIPALADRATRAEWERAGSPDAASRARARARSLLAAGAPPLLSADAESRLQSAFPGL